MDIRDLFVGDRADMTEGAMSSKEILDAHVRAGFTRKEAMQILLQMIASTIEGQTAVQIMQATGQMEDPDGHS